MPLCHLVTFTFKPGTPAAAIAELASALDELAARGPALAYHHGGDLKIREGNADYAVTAVFKDPDALQAYLSSPEHLHIVNDLLTPHLQSRSAVQFDVRSFGGPPSPTG